MCPQHMCRVSAFETAVLYRVVKAVVAPRTLVTQLLFTPGTNQHNCSNPALHVYVGSHVSTCACLLSNVCNSAACHTVCNSSLW